MDIETIFDSLINGQRQQMVEQIDLYGPDFWRDFKDFLQEYHGDYKFKILADVVISYHRIKGE